MKKLFVITMCSLGLVAPLLADGTNQLADDKSRVSYALGMLNGGQWRAQDVDIDPDIYMRGIKDGLAGGPELMTEADARATLQAFQSQFRTRLMAKFKAQGEAFLTTNKLNPGVQVLSVTLPGGRVSELQYLVLTNGTGPLPKNTDEVSVNYRGTLINGTEFDSSFKRGGPAPLHVNGVIRGWTEALTRMPVGSKWRLFIPAELGYGERGSMPAIPPNSALIFDVELLGIVAAPPLPAPAPALTSDIVKVPSAEEIKHGAQPEIIPSADVPKMQAQQGQQAPPQKN